MLRCKVVIFVFLLIANLCCSVQNVFARPPANKVERFFDRNKNRQIDWYEQQLIITHSIYGWVLADTKKMKEFDFNQDMMLGPYEEKKYREGRKTRMKHPLSLTTSVTR